MRKIILACFMFLMVSSSSFAGELSLTDTFKKLPSLTQGVSWSLSDNKLNYLTTAEIMSYKGLAFEVGYSGAADATDHKAVAVLSYDLVNFKKLGVTIPILDLLDFRLGAYVGYGNIQLGTNEQRDGNNELDYGFSLTAISVKF